MVGIDNYIVLLLRFFSLLQILEIMSLSVAYFKIFSPILSVASSLFLCFESVLCNAELLSLMESYLFTFVFIALASGIYSRKPRYAKIIQFP